MKFCQVCDNMYYIRVNEQDTNQLAYYCRNCGHVDSDITMESICVLRTDIDVGKKGVNVHNIVNKYTKLDPTLPRVTNLPCPNAECKTNTGKAKREVLYIRYDDDNMQYLYMCCECDTVWHT